MELLVLLPLLEPELSNSDECNTTMINTVFMNNTADKFIHNFFSTCKFNIINVLVDGIDLSNFNGNESLAQTFMMFPVSV